MTALLFAALTVLDAARKFTRRLRYRWALLRHAPVPGDGERLNADEARHLTEIMRGLGQTTAEPSHQNGRRLR